jgi:hypothetical protein
MKVRTTIRAGTWQNHNETQVRDRGNSRGLRVKTKLKAGGIGTSPSLTAGNHNETLMRDRKGLKTKTGVRAGAIVGSNHNETLLMSF